MRNIIAIAIITLALQIAKSQGNQNHNLVAYYTFDGHTVDSSCNSHHGFPIGAPSYLPGVRNLGLSLNGIDQSVDVLSTDCLNSIDTAFTFTGWINLRSLSAWPTWLAFWCKGESSAPTSSAWAILYQYNTHPSVRFVSAQQQFEELQLASVTSGIDYNAWTFFTWTFNKGYLRVYKNGNFIVDAHLNTTQLRKDQNAMRIGRDQPGADEHLDGILDDLCIYNYVLTDQQIQELFSTKGCFVETPKITFDTICSGESISGHNTSGIYFVDTIVDTHCHLKNQLNLHVIAVDTSLDYQTICSGDTLLYFGMSITQPGTYQQTVTGIDGCPDLDVLEVSQQVNVHILHNYNLCIGDTLDFFQSYITNNGTYTHVSQGFNTCDTIITAVVSFGSYIPHHSIDSICTAQTYPFHDSILTAPGLYQHLAVGTNGACDTLYTLDLRLRNLPQVTEQFTLCHADTIVYGGQQLSGAGDYYIQLIGLNGACDTIAHVTIQEAYITIDSMIDHCLKDTLWLGTLPVLLPGIYLDTVLGNPCDTIFQWFVEQTFPDTIKIDTAYCNGLSITINQLQINTPGVYFTTLIGTAGDCDTVLQLNINELFPDTVYLDTLFCQGTVLSLGSNQIVEPGVYYTVAQGAGVECDTLIQWTTNHFPLPDQFLPSDTVICNPPSITLSSPYVQTTWGQYGSQQQITFTKEDSLIVQYTNSDGCIGEETLRIHKCCGNASMYIPNTFKPESLNNDLFQPFISGVCKLQYFEIYDRWGELVFRSSENDPAWRGNSSTGKHVNPGVYVYVIYLIDSITQVATTISGDVTVVR